MVFFMKSWQFNTKKTTGKIDNLEEREVTGVTSSLRSNVIDDRNDPFYKKH